MRLLPHRATDLLPFQTCCLRALDRCEFASAHAGMSKDGTITWIFQGAVLEVISTQTGQRVSSLSISQLLQDPRASIVCVKEYKCQGHMWLLIACNRTVQQGLICLLNVGSSMVVKTVEVPRQITSMEPVLTGGKGVPRWAVSEQLQQFYGVVAIGTEGGYVYLVDMRMDDTIPSSYSLPCAPPLTLHLLDPRVREVNLIRQQAADSGHHLALQLGVEEGTHSEDYFHFRRPDQHTLQSFEEDEVRVTCLKYIPQIGTLAVGYNFGAFQLWRLYNPALEYASAVNPDDLPVAYFAYQEPENDPKNFAYLWVGRDDRLSEQKQESLCSVSLYQMCYAQKCFYANYGNFYQELTSIVLRIEHILTSDPYNSRNTTTWTSQLVAAYTITDHSYHPPSILSISDSFEDGSLVQDLSLCVFVWEAQDSRPGSSTDVFLSIFDMNRWYHAQMPSRIKCVSIGGQELCPFFAVYRLTDFVQRDEHGILVDVQFKPSSLLRFINNSPMPPEQHFYPSSLAFDTLCIFTNGLMTLSFLGIQRQVLADLEASGPLSLLQPTDVYHCCVQVGLLPRSTDIPTSASLEECQRKAILTMALEHDRVRFITNCVRSWADGEFIHQGCTLQFLLAWTWERVMALKQQIDLTSQPLYDWSGTPVDQRMIQVLESSASSLAHLRTILRVMLTQSSPITEQGEEELKCRIQVVSLLLQHLKVVIWFIHSCLLPEYEEAGGPLPSHYTYPASELTQVFRDRRAQLQKFDSSIEPHKVILIDALIHNAGDAVSQLWRSEGGTGQYPPPSLRVALAVYLLDGVNENIKDAIILYLLFDLAAVAHGNQEQLAEKIPQFANAFDVPLGLVQQVHGFWLIDHMNAEEGLKQLLGIRAQQDLGSWQHNCILQALMYQGETNAASRYLTLRTPPIFTMEDVKMRLTIMVADRLVWQALDFVRSTCGANDQQEMLQHVFQECKQYKLMENLFRLPLSHQEEQYLQNFLSEDADPTSAELLVLHLLQRAQYVPAIRLNDRLRHRVTMDFSAKARQRAKTRNVIVEGFRHALPAAQQCLINKPFSSSTLPVIQRVEVPRPKPLSTAVTKTVERRVNSQSALIMAVMDKVAEVEAASECGRRRIGADQDGRLEMQADSESVIEESLHQRDRPLDNNNQGIDDPGPFLCTPRNTWTKSRLSLTGTVVYPSIKSALTPHFPLPNISLPGLLDASLIPTSINHTSYSKSKVFTADCMSLLQTPKINHRTTPGHTVSLQKAVTPHSILKVSRLRTSPPIINAIKFSSKESQHKQLMFSGAIVHRSSNSSTPSNISPASTPSPTSATPPEFLDKTKKTHEPIMPKHLRFAEPEMREVSPTYGSPDGLTRRPLRSPPDHTVEEGMAVTEDLSTDEEITFNFSQRRAAVPELTKSDSEFSISPITFPASGPADDRQCPASGAVEAIEKVIDDVDMQDSRYALNSAVHESDRNKPVEKQICAGIFPHVKHFQVLPPKSTVTRPQSACSVNVTKEPEEEHVAMEESQEEAYRVDAVTELGSNTFGEERDKGGEMEPARLSPLSKSSPQRPSNQLDVLTHEQVFEVSAQEERTLHSSHEHHEKIEISIFSRSGHLTREVAKTTLIIDSTGGRELVPNIECEVGPERAVPIGSELKTKKLHVDAGESEEPNVDRGAGEDEGEYTKIMKIIDAIDVDPPTPIKLSPQKSTSEQPVVRRARKPSSSSTRIRQTKSSIKESAMPILQKENPQPSPAKQQRISVDRELETEEIPPLLLEAGDDGNLNDNRSRSPSPPLKAAQENLKTTTPERTRRASKSSLPKKDSKLTIQTDSSGDTLAPLVTASLSPSRRSTRHTTPVRTVPPTTVTVSTASERPVSRSLEKGMDIVEPLAATSGALALQEKDTMVPSSPSRNLRRRSKTPELRPISVEPVTPVRRSNPRSKTPELTRVLPKPSPSRRRRQSEKSEDGSPNVPEAEEGVFHSRRTTRSSLARERASSADSTESVPASPSRPLTRSSKLREGTVSESLITVSSPSTPTRRSLRERSKTPELSPSRQTTRIKKKDTTRDITTKELAAVTEQVRSSRRQKKDDLPNEHSTFLPAQSSTFELMPGPAGETRETQGRKKTPQTRRRVPSIGREEVETKAEPAGEMEITEFEFAAPTPVPNVHAGDKTLEAAAELPGMAADSDVLTFTFSSPITQLTRHMDQLSSVLHTAPLLETVPGTLLHDEQPLQKPSTSTAESHSTKASTRIKRGKTQLRKKGKTIVVPSASPSDSPIMLLSPGTEADIKLATGVKKQPSVVGGRGRSAKRVVLARLRKRRQVELW